MRLFIAEKPSMAREISKCLPENKNIQKRNGYFIQGDDVVTWVVCVAADPRGFRRHAA